MYHEQNDRAIRSIEEFLHAHQDIDAVFFATNYIANNGLLAIRNLGLDIGQDLGVIVFDDNLLFRLLTPSVTSISQPIREIANAAFNLLLRRLSEGDMENHAVISVELSTTLEIRESSIPISAMIRTT